MSRKLIAYIHVLFNLDL